MTDFATSPGADPGPTPPIAVPAGADPGPTPPIAVPAGADPGPPVAGAPGGAGPTRRILHRLGAAVAILLATAAGAVGTGHIALSIVDVGTPDAAAHGDGNDAIWLGHAWVDGRRKQSDVDALAARLRHSGIRDLFVHAGPFGDDGTLDPALHPRAGWFVHAVHDALPGVRVQAWLGAHPVTGQLDLASPVTRTRILAAVTTLLDGGFDGIHYDFEPVRDGDPDLVTILRDTRPVTRARHAVLSLSASLTEPMAGPAAVVRMLPGRPVALWSTGYLGRLARQVDQVALMAYDTTLFTSGAYSGYVRRATRTALAAVPDDVALLIGVPAYQEENMRHHRRVETIGAALRGVRLGVGSRGHDREFGVAIYVDFTMSAADWSRYQRDWADIPGG